MKIVPEPHLSSRKRPAGIAAGLGLALAMAFSAGLAGAGEAAPAAPDLRPGAATQAAQAAQAPTALIELDGSLSENPDGGNLQYEWKQVAGPPVTLSDPTAAKPNFRTAEPGIYRFELVVTANGLRSAATPVEIEIERANLPPVAKVPAEVRGQVGRRIEIDGRESFDPEGKELTYRWRALGEGLALPASALNEPVLVFSSETDGVYEVELVVSDGETASPPAVARLAIAPLPRPPVARAKIVPIEIPTVAAASEAAPAAPAGPRPTARIAGPATAEAGAKVTLDGAGSSGRAGAALKYLWRQKSGPFVADLAAVSGGRAGSFTPPRAGEYEFELVVTDGAAESEPALHRLTVRREAEPPVAVVVAPARAEVGSLVKMDATQSYDPAGGKLNYRWRQTAGPQVRNYALDARLGDAAPAFTPTAAGTYVFEVVATTGRSQSRPVAITIDVTDAGAAGQRQLTVTGPEVGSVGESLTLAVDAGAAGRGGGALQFRWRQAEGPANALLASTDASQVTVTPPAAGRYTFDVAALEGGAVAATARRSIEVFAPEPAGASLRPSVAAPALTVPAPESLPASQSASSGGGRSLIPELQPLPSIAPASAPVAATASAVSPAPPAPELTPLPLATSSPPMPTPLPLATPMPMAAPALPAARQSARPRPAPVPLDELSGAPGRAAAQIHPAALPGGMPAMPDLP